MRHLTPLGSTADDALYAFGGLAAAIKREKIGASPPPTNLWYVDEGKTFGICVLEYHLLSGSGLERGRDSRQAWMHA